MITSLPLVKVGTRAFLLITFVLVAAMLLPHAAHAQSLPYPIDPNLANPPDSSPWYCHDQSGGYGPNYGEVEVYCNAAEIAQTEIVGEFTITDIAGHTAEAYILPVDSSYVNSKGTTVTVPYTIGYVNSSITVYPGEPLTYSWSLDPYMMLRHWECTNSVLNVCLNFNNVTHPQYFFYQTPLTASFNGSMTQYGSMTVTAPASGTASSTVMGPFGITTSSSVTVTTAQTCVQVGQGQQCSCPSGYHATTQGTGQGGNQTICSKTTTTTRTPPIITLDIKVIIGGSAPAIPTLTITATPPPPISTVQSTVISATFAAASGDTLKATALNVVPPTGPEYTLPGYIGVASNYSYTFATTTLGTFTFKPYVETNAYPAWATEGKSVTVTVTTPLCSAALNGGANGNPSYPNCICKNGGTYYPANNSCSSATSCLFNGFSIPSGNTVTAYQASSVISPATCQSQVRTCTNGVLSGSYAYSSCTVTIPSGVISSALTATPSRVHPGNPSTLTWTTSNMASCSVKSSDTPPQTLSTALSSANTQTPDLTRAETYTLFCLDANNTPFVSQVQVKLVPVVQEI